LVFFPSGTGEFLGIKKYPRIATKPMDVSETAYLIGFGTNSFYSVLLNPSVKGGTGIRGWGTTQLRQVKDGIVYTPSRHVSLYEAATDKMYASSENSRALSGDSGGSVYNKSGEISAVVSEFLNMPERVAVGKLFRIIPIDLLTGWETQNTFSDVTTEENHKLIETALEAGESENPVDILVEEGLMAPAAAERLSRLAVTPSPFAHVTIRTGIYETPSGNKLQLMPLYFGKNLHTITVRERSGDRWGNDALFRCFAGLCRDQTGDVVYIPAKNKFLRMTFEPAITPGQKRKGKSAEEYFWKD
jgi:hypothetical protein